MFHEGTIFGCLAGRTAGETATSSWVSPQEHEHGVGDPQHPSGNGSGGVQQHLPLAAAVSDNARLGRRREILFSQWQPSQRQKPNGVIVPNSTATIVTQATHCRNENGFTDGIISSITRRVNNLFVVENQKCGEGWSCRR